MNNQTKAPTPAGCQAPMHGCYLNALNILKEDCEQIWYRTKDGRWDIPQFKFGTFTSEDVYAIELKKKQPEITLTIPPLLEGRDSWGWGPVPQGATNIAALEDGKWAATSDNYPWSGTSKVVIYCWTAPAPEPVEVPVELPQPKPGMRWVKIETGKIEGSSEVNPGRTIIVKFAEVWE